MVWYFFIRYGWISICSCWHFFLFSEIEATLAEASETIWRSESRFWTASQLKHFGDSLCPEHELNQGSALQLHCLAGKEGLYM